MKKEYTEEQKKIIESFKEKIGEIKDRVNELPMGFIFATSEEEALEKVEAYKEHIKRDYPEYYSDTLVNGPAQSIMTKPILEDFMTLVEEDNEIKKEYFEKYDFVLFNHIYEELWNIEYGFEQDDERIVDEVFGMDIEALQTKYFREYEILQDATRQYMKDFLYEGQAI